jgi:hypothetical protein
MRLRHTLILLALGLLAACSTPHTDMKSPCAGNDGSPCGPRRPVNDWWLNPGDQS